MIIDRAQAKKEGKTRFDPNNYIQSQIKHELRQTKRNENLHKLLITGGPCAGKTTALAELHKDLLQLGFLVLTVPEAATILMKGGALIISSAFSKS